MISPVFKKSLILSLLGHIAVFSIFSFSFGNRIPTAGYNVFFRGSILRDADLTQPRAQGDRSRSSYTFNISEIKKVFMGKTNTSLLDKANKEYPLISSYYLKPEINLAFNEDKIIFIKKSTQAPPVQRRKESVIMLYPTLPYNFLLYFKDRQAVHIELIFNIISTGQTNSIEIRRKISSGNLEADLLSMRYIGHYLFVQQSRFSPNNWQTVKIELTPKND